MSRHPHPDRRPAAAPANGRVLAQMSACALLWLCSAAQAQSGTTLLLSDRFDQAAAWTQKAEGQTARFADGRVMLPQPADPNSPEPLLSRRLDLPPGSAWQASVRVTTAADAGADAAAGLALIGPNGTQVAVLLRPQEGDVVVIHRDGSTDRWLQPLLRFTRSPAVQAHGKANTLGVASRDGRLFVSVNDQFVGATRSLDFAPSTIALRNTRTAASYEALQVQRTGVDSRLGRLLGLVKTPGARVLFADAPTSAIGAVSGLFGSASSLLKGLTGDAPKDDKPPSPDKAWGPDSKDGAYRRDNSRGVVTMRGSEDDVYHVAAPDMLTALPGAPSFVQADIRLLSEPLEDDGPGVYAEGAIVNKDGDARDLVLAKLSADSLELSLWDASKKKWEILDDSELGQRPAKTTVQLRLVFSGRQVIVFLDGRWITAADLPRAIALDRAGVRVEGKTTAEFTAFTAAEL